MSTDSNVQSCGTYAAYQRHHREARKAGVEAVIDDACAKAHREYQDNWRKTTKKKWQQRQTTTARVNREALARLAAKFPREFKALKNEVIREHDDARS